MDFVVHALSRVAFGLVLFVTLLAFGATESNAAQRVASGTYLGNGSSNRLISDPGFLPSFVLIKSTDNRDAVMRIEGMPTDMSKRMTDGSSLDDRMIRSFESEGFRIGDRNAVNQSGAEYYWIAVQSDPSTSHYGEYTGTGVDRSISGLGFAPKFVVVFPSGGWDATMKHSWMLSSVSYPFGPGGGRWSHIENLVDGGFNLGDADRVNQPGETFYFLALGEVAEEIQLGGYWGSGSSNRWIDTNFSPDFALVRSSGSFRAVYRSFPDNGDISLPFETATAPISDRIRSLGADGFGVGSTSEVNNSFVFYFTVALANTESDPVADLAVQVGADPTIIEEDATTVVHVDLENLGPDATDADLTFVYPPEFDYVTHALTNGTFDSGSGTWSLPSVPADGSTETLSVTLQPVEGSAGTTTHVRAGVTSSGLPDPVNSNDADSVTVTIVVPAETDLQVVTSSNVGQANEGDSFELHVELENLGPADATGLVVEDLLPAGLDLGVADAEQGSYDGEFWDVGSIAAGDRRSLVLNVTSQAGTAGTTITNSASIYASDQPDPDSTNNSDSVDIDVLGADLQVTQSVMPDSVAPGDTLSIEVEIFNAGPDPAEDVEVGITAPTEFEFLDATPEIGTYGGGTWSVSSVSATSTITLTLSYRVSSDAGSGSLDHLAEITSVTTGDPNTGQESSTVSVTVQPSNFVLLKSVDNPSPDPGDVIEYLVEFRNESIVTFPAFVIQDELPSEVSYTGHTIVRPDGASNASSYDPDTGLWVTTALAPDETIQLYINAEVASGTEGVTFTNTAIAVDVEDEGSSNDYLQASVDVTVRSVDLTSSVDVDPQNVAVGESVTFAATIANQGPDDASGATVKVTIPREFNLLSVDAPQGSFDTLGSLWTLGDLAAGENTTLTLVLEAKAEAAGQDFSMTATATAGVPGDIAPSNNSSSDSVHVFGADIAVSKSASESIIIPGNSVDFEIVVTNLGPDASQDVRIRDRLPAGLDYESHDVTSGAYSSGSGNWDISSISVGATETLTITATVTSAETVTNTASRISSTPFDTDSRNNSASAEVGTVSADLSVDVGAAPTTLYEGTTGSLTVVVTNEGPSEATGVSLQEYFPEPLDLTAADPSQGSYDEDTHVWSAGTLDVGESESLTLSVYAPQGSAGAWDHEAVTLSFDQVDPVSDNNGETVSGSVLVDVDLAVAIAALPSVLKEGDEAQITVTVENDGQSPGTGAVLGVNWDPVLEWVSHSAEAGTFDPLSGMWALAEIDPGQSIDLSVTLKAVAGSSGESPVIDASVTMLDQPDNNSSNDSAATSVDVSQALTVVAEQTAAILVPGAEPVEMVRLVFTNPSVFDETLDALEFAVSTIGPGESDELSASWQDWQLREAEETITTATVSGSTLGFQSLGLSIPSGGGLTLTVWSGATLTARDSDVFDLSIADESGITLASGAVPEAAWPLDPDGAFTVDGFSSAQLNVRVPASVPLEVDGEPALVFDVDVSANGYEADVLQSITLLPQGDLDSTGVASFEVWRAAPSTLLLGGDLPGENDTLLGSPTFADGAWVLDGLSETVEPSGARIYGLLSVGADAVIGSSVSFQLAGGTGLEYASANDGPLGDAVDVSGTYTVVPDATPTASVTPVDLTLDPFVPGAEERTVLRFSVSYPGPDTLDLSEVEVRGLVDGDGTPEELDASWEALEIFVSEPSSPGALAGRLESSDRSALLAHEVQGGVARFTDLGIQIPPGRSVDISVVASASIQAKDGDRMQLLIDGPESLVFGSEVIINSTWPLASSEPTPVDGMSSAQIEVSSLSGVLVPAGTNGVNVFGFVVPANGYAEDVFDSLTLVNVGDATAADITLELFQGTTSLGVAASGPDGWTWSGLAVPIAAGGEFFRVQAHVAEEASAGRTIQLELPVAPTPGIQMASGNDGPIDQSAGQVEPFEIVPANGALSVYVQSEIWTDLVPGDDPISVLRLTWNNGTVGTETLEAMTLAVTSMGSAEDAVVESLWQPFQLWVRPENDEPQLLSEAVVADGSLNFSDLAIDIEPGENLTLEVRAGAELGARDGDLLDLEFEYEATQWAGEPEMVVLGATNPPGFAEVNGMSAAQIQVHSLAGTSIEAGTSRNVVFDFTVPANGYETDELNRVDVLTKGSAEVTDFDRFEIWSDDGDGVFSSTSDARLGQMRFTGDRWEITGLELSIPVDGQRLFITTDVAGAALESRTLELVLPAGSDVGLGMASGNDGPMDAAVESGSELIISSVDRVALAAREIGAGTVHPGESGVSFIHLFATNTYTEVKQIDELVFDNASVGLGDETQLDEAFDVLALFEDDGDGVWEADADRLLGTNSFDSGNARFRNLGWAIPPGETSYLFLVGDVSVDRVRDGDVLFVRLSDPIGVVFDSPTALTGDWPITSGARLSVDGLVVDQIEVGSPSSLTLGPGQGPALAMKIGVPSNGYVSDLLEGVAVGNASEIGSDVGEFRLWADGGNGSFDADAGDDTDLGPLVRVGDEWITTGLSTEIPEGGRDFFVSLIVGEELEESATVELFVPVGGIDMQSENDGPVDGVVQSQQRLTLSSAPLLTSIQTNPGATNVEQIFDVRIEVSNRSGERIENIIVPEIGVEGEASLSVLSGPEPARLDLSPTEAGVMTWQVQGPTPGTIQIKAQPEGRSSDDGTSRSSLEAASSPHEIRLAAEGLELFALGSFPVTLSYGQVGVVPLSFTFRNPGASASSDIDLHSFRIRVVDEAGDDVDPSTLFERIVVNEGNRIYLTTTEVGSDAEIELDLTTPIAVTTSEPTTISLRVDIAELSPVSSYRILVESPESFDAVDATNGAPVTVQLAEGTFPIVSGLAQLVSEATFVEVSSSGRDTLRAAPGTASLSVLAFDVTAQGGSETRIGSFALSVEDEAGEPHPDLAAILRRVTVKTPLQTLSDQILTAGIAGDSVVVRLGSSLTIPSGSVVPVTLEVDLQEDAMPSWLRFRLEDPESFDARDANTGGAVTVLYPGNETPTGELAVESIAEAVEASGEAMFPGQLAIGSRGIEALRLRLYHPGGDDVGRIAVRSLVAQFWNQNRDGVVPGDAVSAFWAEEGGMIVGLLSPVPRSGTSAGLELDGVVLEPGQSRDLSLFVDIEAGAAAGWLELTMGPDQIQAFDINSNSTIEVAAPPDEELPVFSGLTQLTAPPRELFVEIESAMPAALVRDGGEVKVGDLDFSHPADEGSGPIQIEHLTLRFANEAGEVPMESEIKQVALYRDGELWGSFKVRGDAVAKVEGESIFLSEGEAARFEIRAIFETEGVSKQASFGLFSDDIGIVQPEGAAFLIEARGKTGSPFPLWTEMGSFGSVNLEDSYGNFPNPFAAGRELTNFVYYMPESGRVSLKVFTLRGQEVATLIDGGEFEAGLHQNTVWDGRNGKGDLIVNGVYLAELEVTMGSRTERILRKVAVVR